MRGMTIPWATPQYWGNEQDYINQAIQSGWISEGEFVARLESDFASFCNTPYAISCSNGTSALHMAYLALNISRGDEVIVPGFGFLAAANVALHVGAKPVFSEVNSENWCMTAEFIEECITKRTKAIIPIHTYGNMCDMDPIQEIADKYNLVVIEDAAEAIGSMYKGRMAGTIAAAGVFSFQATKTITTGEGGAVITSSNELSKRMQLFRSHGMASRRYWHDVAGHNFRLTNFQAAIGCAQLESIDKIRLERARVYAQYREILDNIVGVTFQKFSNGVEPLIWAVAIRLDSKCFPQGRDNVIKELEEIGVETRPGFYPASMMGHLYEATNLLICEEVSRQIICLPSSPTLTDEEIAYVCTGLKTCKR